MGIKMSKGNEESGKGVRRASQREEEILRI